MISIVLPKGDTLPFPTPSKQGQRLVYQQIVPRGQDVQVVVVGIGLELATSANGPGKSSVTLAAKAGSTDDLVSLNLFTVKGKGAVK